MREPRPLLAIRVALFVLAAAVVALLPRFLSDFRASQLALVAIYFIALLGLGVLTGYSGQISLGHGAFMAIGGYTTGILTSDQGLRLGGHTFSTDLPDVATIPLGGLLAGIAGFLFGVPALRLTGLYLALATFAVAVSLPQVLRRFETFTGGSTGINLPGHTFGTTGVTILGRDLTFNDYVYYLSWSIALVLFVAAWLLLRGRTGRALRAIRDNEIAAGASGVSLARYKTLAFGVSAFYAGIAGSLFAIVTTIVSPDTFPVSLSIFLLAGLVVGGLGYLAPLVLGALLIQFLPDLAQYGPNLPGLPSVLYGAVVIALMLVLPTGVGGLLDRAISPLTTRLYTRS